jgi:hypothetical protein
MDMEINEENVSLKNAYNSLAYKYNLLVNNYKELLSTQENNSETLPQCNNLLKEIKENNTINQQHENDINYLKKGLIQHHEEEKFNIKTNYEEQKIHFKRNHEEEKLYLKTTHEEEKLNLKTKYEEDKLVLKTTHEEEKLNIKYLLKILEKEILDEKIKHENEKTELKKELTQHVEFIRNKLQYLIKPPNQKFIRHFTLHEKF